MLSTPDDVLTSISPITPAPQPLPVTQPQIVYNFLDIFIGQELWANGRLVRVRSVYRPYNKPRWQHAIEADDIETQERTTLVTGVPLTLARRENMPETRYWLKYQGSEVWVIYCYRHGQLFRYQGGSYRLLDVRHAPTNPPVLPRGTVEVTGAFAPVMQSLLSMSNDKHYLAGEEMGAEWHERYESYCREINQIAAKSFWYDKLEPIS